MQSNAINKGNKIKYKSTIIMCDNCKKGKLIRLLVIFAWKWTF